MKIISALLLVLCLTLGTGCGIPSSAQTVTHPPGWTPSSTVSDQGNGFFDIGAEFLAPVGFYKADIPFQLPSGHTIAHFHATASWNAPCKGDVLAVIFIDGKRSMPIIIKTDGGAQNVSINYDLPYPTGSGNALLHAEANPECSGHYAGMSSFEIQGSLEVQ